MIYISNKVSFLLEARRADKSRNGNQGDECGGDWSVGLIGGGGSGKWIGASVSCVDGHVSEGMRPSHCERGDTWPMMWANVRRVGGRLSGEVDPWPMCTDVRRTAVDLLTAYQEAVGWGLRSTTSSTTWLTMQCPDTRFWLLLPLRCPDKMFQ